MSLRGCALRLALLLSFLLLADCGNGAQPAARGDVITLYTCVNDTTIQPVIKQFEQANPGKTVNLYRAPTGDLNARVAGDVRSGGLKADVIWACDPLTMQNFVNQHLIGGWTPRSDIDPDVRTSDYVGVAVLYLVAVTHKGVAAPHSWADLAGPNYAGAVAVPNPGFAASALGALGYFTQNKDYGFGFYAKLKKSGAVQVNSPDDVTNGVAQGVYKVGMTIASSAYTAQKSGSPITIVWPKPGAIAVYGPIGLASQAAGSETAKAFISYVTSKSGQALIGSTGSYPTLAGVQGPVKPPRAPIVYPDWAALSTQKDSLLKGYQRIFGG
jgi:iron(III) transport system substrate-binding protein